MPLRCFRRQYGQLSQFVRWRIIGMMEAMWSTRRVALQLSHSDCVVSKCWDKWIHEMSFTRRTCSGRPRQTSHREGSHIVRNARVKPTASSAAIQAQVASSLGVPVSSQSIRSRLADGHLGLQRPLSVLPLTPTHRRLCLEYSHARGNWTVQRNGTRSSLVTNPDSISEVMTTMFVCGDPVVNVSVGVERSINTCYRGRVVPPLECGM
ncbi:transposable element Tcb2 transposase [Trichonephila clavipes]|nr:transposable element Tcb2 transposase [Trichonephila clavipes]